MHQVYYSQSNPVIRWNPFLYSPVLLNEAREIAIYMKQLRPEWEWASGVSDQNGLSFRTDK